MGTFDAWVDLDLLHDVMSGRPSWTLVLAGTAKVSLERLLSLGNVHFLGRVPSRTCDLFRTATSASSRSASVRLPQRPLRASSTSTWPGLPVLCTPFLDPELFDGRVAIGPATAEEFSQAIEGLLTTDSPTARQARRSFVRDHSWTARFDLIEGEVARLPYAG